MLQVYTGNGKGKTTAAFGQALRATGHGWHVLIVQFMKGYPDCGEVIAAKGIENLEVVQTGTPAFVEKGNPSSDDLAGARRGLKTAREAISSGNYQMIVLDELNVAVEYGLLSVEDALDLVAKCPDDLELVFTGRYARKEIIDRAGLVSEVREIKHPAQQGLLNRKGIDY
ncbi:cob(I)yrinic acid a,c-diamide adenosyltransferase [candidate division WOR-3 bacterium JGI_Cruoil_03_51_56]|uniref:Cob(I)yrinic acid a,c-diamide adenosyltransferase n=1 Tax=candidate division WOR-3 bacterium JGI_Cruoil_03_51_56 TaxID=1973747 RepID=A0A235BRY6_UNCW3|nr:MAG: cob(I)yrinic acid a,c-diamide adenosyltransferase [candidate division WOR-3 bacterium JGI_Cruoil_03_51_56]